MFKKNEMTVTCNYSEYHPEDIKFLMDGIDDRLSRKYGMCFRVEVEMGDVNKVEVVKNNILYTDKKIRAIKLRIFRMVKSFNRN